MNERNAVKLLDAFGGAIFAICVYLLYINMEVFTI